MDLVALSRMERACKNERFVQRVFTETERRQAAGSIRRLAGDFAVKEAVAKAMGTGVRGFELCEIACHRDALGAPKAVLCGKAALLVAQKGIDLIHISITNEAGLAAAMAVCEGQSAAKPYSRNLTEAHGMVP